MTVATIDSRPASRLQPACDMPVGVWLDPVEPQVAVVESAAAAREADLVASSDAAIPASVLVPRFSGEPVRVDRVWPPHPRGCGERWPAEARVNDNVEPGRLPVAYAWMMLHQQQTAQSPLWRWRHDDGESTLAPAEAIAHTLADLTRTFAPGGDSASGVGGGAGARSCVTVVPDGLCEPARHALIAQSRQLGVNVRLLWRSVASTMAWCDEWASELDPPSNLRDALSRTPGSLLCLHLGLTHWELSIVDLVWRETHHGLTLTPLRRRPTAPMLPSFALELLHRVARRSLEMSYQQPTAGRVWELMWCTPWLNRVIDLLADPAPSRGGGPADGIEPLHNLSPHVRAREFIRQQWRQGMQQLFGSTRDTTGMVPHHAAMTPTNDRIRDWCAGHRKAIDGRTLVGAVVTGQVARVAVDGEPLGLRYLRDIWPRPMNAMLAGQSHTPVGLLARCGAEHAARLRAAAESGEDQAMFLDTLPRIRVAAMKDGRPQWLDLVDDHDLPVTGHVRWHRFERLAGLGVRAGRPAITLALWHDDLPTVHTVTGRLPQRLISPRRFNLSVSIDPGQGFPRIEATPMDDPEGGTIAIPIDWRTLRDTGRTPEAYVKA